MFGHGNHVTFTLTLTRLLAVIGLGRYAVSIEYRKLYSIERHRKCLLQCFSTSVPFTILTGAAS